MMMVLRLMNSAAARQTAVHKVISLMGVLMCTSGCATELVAPCLRYEPQNVEKTVFMRGYGEVHMTSESLVCTKRDDLYAGVGKVR